MKKLILALFLVSPLLTHAEEAKIPGGLDKSVIDQGVKKVMPKLSACAGKGGPTGKVQTRFTIGPDGRVSDVKILNSELNNPKTEGCLVDTLKGISFPNPVGGGTVQVDYPFVFSRDKAAPKKKH